MALMRNQLRRARSFGQRVFALAGRKVVRAIPLEHYRAGGDADLLRGAVVYVWLAGFPID